MSSKQRVRHTPTGSFAQVWFVQALGNQSLLIPGLVKGAPRRHRPPNQSRQCTCSVPHLDHNIEVCYVKVVVGRGRRGTESGD